MILPKTLETILTDILKEEYDDFIHTLDLDPTTSIHLNKHKLINTDIVTAQKVPWHKMGCHLSERPTFHQEPFFHAGAYYVQESSSMFLAEAIRQLNIKNREEYPITALDLCASPGGKSILMESALPADSLILCNEIIASRHKILRHNLDKWGAPNTYTSQNAPESLRSLSSFFDFILVDAPCSGEGMLRKTQEVLTQWSEKSVAGCALRQQSILQEAKTLLKPGGYLIYSTCAFNPTENIDNAIWLDQNGFQNIQLNLDPEWNIFEIKKQDVHGYQFFPHRVKGEGFFISCFQKTAADSGDKNSPHFRENRNPFWTPVSKKQMNIINPWLAQPEAFDLFQNPKGQVKIILKVHREKAAILESRLRQKAIGVLIGTFKGVHFIPSHQLALSKAIATNLPAIELSKEQALNYLKKENFELPSKASGWTLIRYQGLNLGWIKALPNRFNNYLPNHFKI